MTSLLKSLAICSLILLGSHLQSFANDAKSKSILDKVTAQIQNNPSFKTSFSYNALDKKNRTIGRGTGTLMISGNKYNISTSDQKIVSDGKTVWTYLKSNNEVHITNYNSNDNSLNPASFFATNFERDYTYTYKGLQKVGKKSTNSIYLVPKGAKPFKSLLLYVDNNGNISGGLITDKNGNKFSYNITQISKANIGNEHFTFNARAYKGIDVIDLR